MRGDLFNFFKHTLLVLLIVTLGYSPVFYFNIYEDPYGIFTSDFDSRRIEPNNHFIKMRYLLSNQTNFDSFIFGSSRANNVDPKKLINGNYFNMYYSLGIPKEHLEDIELLISNGYIIKNVIIFLDYSSYSTDTDRSHDMLRRPYSAKSAERMKSYIDYAFQVPTKNFIESYYKNPIVPIYKNMFISGRAENIEAETYIETHKEQHIADPKFDYLFLGYQNNLEETIYDLTILKKRCDENQINLSFVMNPIHKTTFLANNQNLYFEFMRRFAAISNFYDFSGLNKITCNNYYYYEASHYRPVVGDAMIDFIQFDKKIDTIPDFGFIVTKQNVSDRISFQKQQIEKFSK